VFVNFIYCVCLSYCMWYFTISNERVETSVISVIWYDDNNVHSQVKVHGSAYFYFCYYDIGRKFLPSFNND